MLDGPSRVVAGRVAQDRFVGTAVSDLIRDLVTNDPQLASLYEPSDRRLVERGRPQAVRNVVGFGNTFGDDRTDLDAVNLNQNSCFTGCERGLEFSVVSIGQIGVCDNGQTAWGRCEKRLRPVEWEFGFSP